MQRIRNAILITTLLASPIVGHASDVAPKTRAEVRAELIVAELASQVPYSSTYYPAAQADPATVYVANRAVSSTASGSQPSSSAASGIGSERNRPAASVRPTEDGLYRHH